MSNAIVTGASRGLGLALTRKLAAEGWNVIVDARDHEALETAVGGLPQVHPIPGDIADAIHWQELVDAAGSLGGLDLVVNNASALGPVPLPPIAELDLRQFAGVFETNVIGPVGLLQAALPLLAESGGIVINVTSDAAVEGYPGWGAYGASKAALEQVSRVLAEEQPGLSVYWADPGDMRTQMHQDAVGDEDISDLPPPEDSVPGIMRLIDERPPSGRYRVQQVDAST